MMNSNKKSEKFGSQSNKIIAYQLSNDDFIGLGWTKVPKLKLCRRIILYETTMIKSHLNWPKSIRGTKYYDNNKTPFIIYQGDSRSVFYPDGNIAIRVETNAKKTYDIYMIFKSMENEINGMSQLSEQMIAAFDTLGNGIILNENNEILLTFNQLGGTCFDKRIALVPFAWTWSKCNAKPTMEVNYIETAAVHLEKVLGKNVKSTPESFTAKNTRKPMKYSRKKILKENDVILSHINDKIIDKNEKLIPIKIICIKINNFISLRILDRRNINLQFFAGNKNIRIELGFDINFKKPLKSFLDDPTWGPKGFLRCLFENKFITNWINSKSNIFELFQECNKGKKS